MANGAVFFHSLAPLLFLGLLAPACGPSGFRDISVEGINAEQPDADVRRDSDGSVITSPDGNVLIPRPDGPGNLTPDAGPSIPAADAAPPVDIVDAKPLPLADRLLAVATGCAKKLTPDYPLDPRPTDPDTVAMKTAAICGLNGGVFWVADLDIDCDGDAKGACNADPDTYAHASNGDPLTPVDTPYVVIPASFKPAGLRTGTVVAVIDNLTKKMTFAVFGDTGDNVLGQASYACAKALGINPDPVTGGQMGNTVTYIVFTGTGTVPDDIEDTDETAALGLKLAEKLITANP